VQITVQLPDDLTQHRDPAREALEALAIAGYCSGNLTAFQASRLLGLGSRFDFEGLLKARNVYDQAYSVEDLMGDLETLQKLEKNFQGEGRRRA